ncbi:MAG: VCBS repeat-containing protein [Planctomycetota bacterium]
MACPTFAASSFTETLILSGVDGSIVHRGPSASAITSLGDLDGDGLCEIALGYPEQLSPGWVDVVRGGSFTQLYRVQFEKGPTVTARQFGAAVAVLDDVDGDGVVDLAVGAPSLNVFLGQVPGWAGVFSGRTGDLVQVFPGQHAGDEFGRTLVGVDDLTGDGVSELVIAAPSLGGAQPFRGPGALFVHDGRTGALLTTIRPPASTMLSMGASMAAPGDVTGDGRPDLLVFFREPAVSPPGSNGMVALLSLPDGRVVWQHQDPSPPHSTFGRGLVAVGDWNGDGRADLLAGGSPSSVNTDRLQMISALPAGIGAFGQGCRGGLPAAPRLSGDRPLVLGGPLNLHVRDVPAGTPAWLLCGASNSQATERRGHETRRPKTSSSAPGAAPRPQGRGLVTLPTEPARARQSPHDVVPTLTIDHSGAGRVHQQRGAGEARSKLTGQLL